MTESENENDHFDLDHFDQGESALIRQLMQNTHLYMGEGITAEISAMIPRSKNCSAFVSLLFSAV